MEAKEQEIVNLVNAWAAAERGGDASVLSGILHDQFVGIGPLGFTLNKEQWLQRFTSGNLTYDSLEIDEIAVRLFQAAAIVIAKQTQVAGFKDQQVKAELRVSITLVSEGDKWLIAGLQFSSIGQPPQFSAKPNATSKE